MNEWEHCVCLVVLFTEGELLLLSLMKFLVFLLFRWGRWWSVKPCIRRRLGLTRNPTKARPQSLAGSLFEFLIVCYLHWLLIAMAHTAITLVMGRVNYDSSSTNQCETSNDTSHKMCHFQSNKSWFNIRQMLHRFNQSPIFNRNIKRVQFLSLQNFIEPFPNEP